MHILIAKGKANRDVDLLDITDLEDPGITSEPRMRGSFQLVVSSPKPRFMICFPSQPNIAVKTVRLLTDSRSVNHSHIRFEMKVKLAINLFNTMDKVNIYGVLNS